MNHRDKSIHEAYRHLCLAVLAEAYNLIIPDASLNGRSSKELIDNIKSRQFFNTSKSAVFIDFLELDHDVVLKRVNDKIKEV